MRTSQIVAITILLAAGHYTLAVGQVPPPTILAIDLEHLVEYRLGDISDPSKFATDPNRTTSAGNKNFGVVTLLGDLVAVNGQPVKGLYAGRTRAIVTSPAPNLGDAIADITRTAIREHIFEILKSDGTPVGTIVSLGFSGGPAPPGAPLAHRGGNWAIIGGTGAFLGARGQVGGAGGAFQTPPPRAASMVEDPANRRTHGGGRFRFILHVIPLSVPQIVNTAAGPAVTHASDFTLVTASRPAAAGEILSLFATGLGPTNPSGNPGQPFPSNPLAVVNSPVEVTVNGKPAEVLTAVGFPSAVDGYQVNFRVPPDTAKGVATVQVSAAWVASTPVGITVQ